MAMLGGCYRSSILVTCVVPTASMGTLLSGYPSHPLAPIFLAAIVLSIRALLAEDPPVRSIHCLGLYTLKLYRSSYSSDPI